MYSVQYDNIENHGIYKEKHKQFITLIRNIIFISVVCAVSLGIFSGLCEYLEYSMYRQNVEVIGLESYLTTKSSEEINRLMIVAQKY